MKGQFHRLIGKLLKRRVWTLSAGSWFGTNTRLARTAAFTHRSFASSVPSNGRPRDSNGCAICGGPTEKEKKKKKRKSLKKNLEKRNLKKKNLKNLKKKRRRI